MSAFTNSSRKLHFKAGSATDIGGGRENQDEFFIWENKSIEALAICVLDGHGREVGKIAANAARAAIVDFLTESSDRILKDPSAILIEAHDIAHRTIKKSFVSALETLGNQVCESEEGYLMKRKTSAEGWTCVHGGTSCTIVLIAQMNIYVANVGDSTAAIFSVQPILKRSDLKFVVDAADLTRLNIGAEDPDNNTNFLVISAEHSPESASEFCRLRHFRPNENDPKYPAIQVVYDVCNHNKRSCAQVFNPNITPLKPSGRGK
jgi:serine/threonine protein phosphatase PrpC